jgi:hypothetical protein
MLNNSSLVSHFYAALRFNYSQLLISRTKIAFQKNCTTYFIRLINVMYVMYLYNFERFKQLLLSLSFQIDTS